MTQYLVQRFTAARRALRAAFGPGTPLEKGAGGPHLGLIEQQRAERPTTNEEVEYEPCNL
jgi:hypothetical protein